MAASSQQTAGQTYSFSYAYNLAGALTSETYPSGRVVTTAYNTINQESGVTGTLGGQPTNYVSTVSYWPHGGEEKYWLANQIVKTYSFTPQLQIGGDWDARYDNGNYFSFIESPITYNTLGSGSNDNGNVQSIALWEGPSFQQSFVYDGLNRLTNASDSGGWSRGFGYDQWGNMWVSSNVNLPLAGNTPTSSGAFNTKNQLNDTTYDGAGNPFSVNGNAMAYDAEERQTSATEPPALGGATEYYYYDGNGQRIEKYGLSGPTVYVYDALGRLASEYTGSAQQNPPCTTCYLSYDHLGSVRLVTDQNANVISRHDYLTFGEEIPSGWDYRNSQFGAVDNVAQRFTGQIRDQETGLDFFEARYYGSALGRFTSPDPGGLGASLRDPQSWNMYAYVRNDPLANVDPFGLDCITTSDASLSGVTVTTERGGSADSCSGTYVNGTVDVNSYSYDGSTLSWSDNSEWAGGAMNFVFGPAASSNSDWGPGSNNLLGARQIGMTAPIGDALLGAALFFIQGPGSLALEGPPVMSLGMLGGKIMPPAAPVEPSTPVGRGNTREWNTTGSNTGATINGRYYTGHALDEMQAQGLTPSVVEETIGHGTISPGNQPGTWKYSTGEASVVVNRGGNVITTHLGGR